MPHRRRPGLRRVGTLSPPALTRVVTPPPVPPAVAVAGVLALTAACCTGGKVDGMEDMAAMIAKLRRA